MSDGNTTEASVRRRSSRRSSRGSTSSRRRRSTRSSKSTTADIVLDNARKGFRKAKKVSTPYIVTIWTALAVLNALIISWVSQQIVKLYLQNVEPENAKGVVVKRKMGNLFHRIFGFLVIDLHPFWERHIQFDIPPEELPDNAIITVNHVSFSDGWMLMGALPYSKNAPKGVAMGPVFDVPIAGQVLKENGEIPVHFEKRPNGKWGTAKGTREFVTASAREYIQNNIPVAVMPEGSITKDGKMLPFKPGFFELAMEENAPVVPVAIWGNQEAWPMDLSVKDVSTPQMLMGPATVYIRVGKPIYPASFESAEDLMNFTQSTVKEMVEGLPNYNGTDFYNQSED